ncbi:Fur family transcriptional regulator [Oscillatoria sp. CS-180]|uniref:Fur family transcriptional regulator n=1 Tax=Oscillatoria sp. CS-180 TaxID=3021720 RepID=UPI00232E519F|nr:Fur family transcriptional regulator [Oscillatoria sp. CS-180]MDB9529652.1 Fur family transcriptional regulator [Oscillatoria sp. CS-180]
MKAKLTRGQQWVYELLTSTSTEITAQDIFAQLQAQGRSLGLATVYRAIKALQLQGLVQARSLTNGEWVYRPASEDCHYLTCLNCGRSFPLDMCPLNGLEFSLQHSSPFTIYYHTLEFFGLCEPCSVQCG